MDLGVFFDGEKKKKDNPLAKQNLEYALHFVEGEFGAGKTLYLTWNAYMLQDEYDYIYANYPLFVEGASYLPHITREILFDLNPEPKEKKALLLLQEAYHYFDRRFWNERNNRNIMKALFQIRKLNVDIVADIRDIIYLDFRIVQDATFFIKANRQLKNFPGIFEYKPYKVRKNKYGNFDFLPQKPIYLNMERVFELYDTTTKTVDMANDLEEEEEIELFGE